MSASTIRHNMSFSVRQKKVGQNRTIRSGDMRKLRFFGGHRPIRVTEDKYAEFRSLRTNLCGYDRILTSLGQRWVGWLRNDTRQVARRIITVAIDIGQSE